MAPTRKSPKTLQLDGLPTIHPNAAGMDIGAEEIVVAVPPDRDATPVRAFRTFTPDLQELVAWLLACRIDTLAMESTGTDWVAIYELLEAAGIVPYLVNARHVRMVPGRKTDWNDAQWLQRMVPGRKTDWNDAQWLQKLHALGLLHASFRPDAEIVALRTLVRYRATVVAHRSPHVNQMQSALKVMNIQLGEVLTDITGLTGMSIMRAIVKGEHDPLTLAQFRAPSCKSSVETIAKALTGTWKDEQIFVLEQTLALYDAYTAQLEVCDRRIEQFLQQMESRGEPNALLPALPPSKHDKKAKNEANFNARALPSKATPSHKPTKLLPRRSRDRLGARPRAGLPQPSKGGRLRLPADGGPQVVPMWINFLVSSLGRVESVQTLHPPCAPQTPTP